MATGTVERPPIETEAGAAVEAPPLSLPPALAELASTGHDWRRPYVEWRVAKGGHLDAIAHAVKNEAIWRLICDVMESAHREGWEAGRDAGR